MRLSNLLKARSVALFSAICVLLIVPAKAASLKLDPKTCVSIPPDFNMKAVGWDEIFREYSETCPVVAPNHKVALSVLTFRLNKADAAGFFRDKPDQFQFPDAILIDLNHRKIGNIDTAFPDHLPGETQLTFSTWKGGMPWLVQIHVVDNAALGTYDLPSLVWHPERGLYQAGDEVTH